PSHYWEPIKCRRLQQAITGKSDPGPTPIHLSDTDTRMINQRLHSSKFSTLLTQLKQAGWKINPAQQTSEKSKTTNTIVACVIDPRTLRDLSNAIFNLNYGGHPFSYSTIFDGGGALHLANDRNLLVPGTYKKCLDYLTVEAGTQSLPVSGVGDRLFKDFFNGPDGPQDLLLKNVMVVEGFHVNIVSEALLRKVGFWYTGYDWTIRSGDMEHSIILRKLHVAHNLVFIEYKPFRYPSVPPLVNSVRRSAQPKLRSDDEFLWHQRSGHLGQKALQALAQAAQNVRIEGTRRLECEHCATTHATQVISRRPRERSPRPFYRVSWDLFDFPKGRSNEQFALIIKEDFSGKIFNHNVQGKTLSEIMRVITAFEAWVQRKYDLRIVEIHQDNDTATLPWRGRSRYEEWAEEKGITILSPPPYTHEPNGSAERAGQELITKSIKMRLSANFPEKLWPEIMDAAAYLHARSPTATRFYTGKNEDEMPKEQAIELADVLDIGELHDPGADIDIPSLGDQAIQTTDLTTESNLGGELPEGPEPVAGQPDDQEQGQAETERSDSLAGDHLRIRTGQNPGYGLATPEQTPEPHGSGMDADRRFPSGIQQGMHQPGGIGDPDAGGLVVTRSRGEGLERPTQLDESPAQPVSTDADDQEGMTTREQLVARGTRRRGRPRASAGSSSRATAPTGDPDVGLSAPTQRTSGRLRGDQLEPDVVHRYMPIRRGRGRSKDPDDQLGGGAAPRGVHALIADLQDMDGPWSDFKHTYIPGINETWEDRASYKTLNAVVMSATLDPSVPQALDSGDRPHRDVLPEPPLTWRELQSHSMRPLFMDASNKEIDLLRKK
ncbi:rve domain containing protein, partial [Pyrenophora tritici-repentis]